MVMRNADPIFSVITPVYNGETFIRETVISVLEKTSDFSTEYIVIDDGSTDRTLEILQTFSGLIRIVSRENRGESLSVNEGISLSRGRFILVVSADDPLLTSDLFLNIEDHFEKENDLVAIYPDWQVIDSKGHIVKRKFLPEFTVQDFLIKNIVLPGPGTIFRRDAALRIGGRNPIWKFVGDYDFWLRLSDIGKIMHRSGVLAQWRQHARSTSIASRGPQMALERIQVIKNYLENTSQKYDMKVSRHAIANSYALAARLIYFSKEVPGKKYLFLSLKLRKGWPERLSFFELIFIILHPISKLMLFPFRKWVEKL